MTDEYQPWKNHHNIAIGDGAKATEPYEIVIKVLGYEGRGTMTPEEFEVVSKVLHRMEFISTKDTAQE
jgi:hypothetical protein